MRIQHNITAMNSYRTYSNNTSKVSKNLEKLSSGYKINRAGDDAAGLAISEKMRVQITGLEQAQSNAKSGISLVQTAEGALTEVHDMLNRMYTLAEQSANGTYSNELDREQLQKEVSSLRTEINRIADSTNYNGINLLDGSLDAETTKAADLTNVKVSDTTKTTSVTKTAAFDTASSVMKEDEKITYTVAWKDGDGAEYSKTLEFSYYEAGSTDKDYAGTTITSGKVCLKASDGTLYTTSDDGSTAFMKGSEFQTAVLNELQKDAQLTKDFTVEADGTKLKFTSTVEGAQGAQVTAIGSTNSGDGGVITGGNSISATSGDIIVGKDSMQKLDLSGVTPFDATGTNKPDPNSDTGRAAIAASTFTVNGVKFFLAQANSKDENLSVLDSDVHVIKLAATDYVPTNDAANVVGEINRVAGTNLKVAAADDDDADIDAYDILNDGEAMSVTDTAGGKALNLQIGDTSETFNQMSVSVKDMHAVAMTYSAKDGAQGAEKAANGKSIADIDISTQEGASEAMLIIKSAVNYVSDTRGDLGALQNRLDHTINNLGVMQENIQDAESVIRDTDVAQEMMNYTKNNILVQSAQAMLAQANQLPQGVLQLLQ